MTAAGCILVGMAAGIVLGALAVYGAMFAWAIKYGKDNEE